MRNGDSATPVEVEQSTMSMMLNMGVYPLSVENVGLKLLLLPLPMTMTTLLYRRKTMTKYFKLTESFTTHDWAVVKAEDETDAIATYYQKEPLNNGYYFTNDKDLEVKEISREEADDD
jgi:hypothetical protein